LISTLQPPASTPAMVSEPHSSVKLGALTYPPRVDRVLFESASAARRVDAALAVVRAARDRRETVTVIAKREVISTTKPATKKPGVRGGAIALSASLGDTTLLSKGERALLDELLARLAALPEP